MLAVSPHPDDVELCCGGLISRMSGKGYSVGIVDLTKGELGTEGTAEARVREAGEAAKILGVQVRENMGFGDCRLDPGFDEAKTLAGVIRQHRPSILICPYGDEQHPDHAASRKLADKAVFLSKLIKVSTGQKAHKVRMVVYYMLHEQFSPSFLVDVTECYGKKLDAIKAYKSQRGLMLGMNGLLRSVELRDQFWGSTIGVKHGEPFFSKTPLRIDDLVAFSR
ncbi:MAG: bacillithiol biosynthesis deacetylase BshB1 [Candidatus Bathyarchaeota archaeon]|nr:MAG: bacillithiol biosynthesis deacetylase BshB1 [Candidatus Bathyarchaeota archaeon]